MQKLTVSELAKLYGYSRQAIYAHINKGNLSKGSDGLIDFSEALRVFGEPKIKSNNVNQSKSIDSQELTQVDLLKRQVDLLEKQLNQALLRENQSLEREVFYQEQIEAMQRLLEAPKPNPPTPNDQKLQVNTNSDSQVENSSAQETVNQDDQQESKHDGLTTSEQEENKRIPVPEHVEPEQPKRGWLSRFFLPNG